jgi:hypothetical protein
MCNKWPLRVNSSGSVAAPCITALGAELPLMFVATKEQKPRDCAGHQRRLNDP